jgi:hypothetical protein
MPSMLDGETPREVFLRLLLMPYSGITRDAFGQASTSELRRRLPAAAMPDQTLKRNSTTSPSAIT